MQIKATGFKEIDEQLAKLGSKDGTRVLRAGMLRAAQPIEDQAKANAGAIPNGSGALKQSIGKRFSVGDAGGPRFFGLDLPALGGKFVVQVAPLRKSRVAVALYNLFYGRKVKGIFYGHLVEYGHRIGTRATGYLSKIGRRSKGRSGEAAGKVGAHPFLLPALNARRVEAVNTLATEIKAGIERMLKRRSRG